MSLIFNNNDQFNKLLKASKDALHFYFEFTFLMYIMGSPDDRQRTFTLLSLPINTVHLSLHSSLPIKPTATDRQSLYNFKLQEIATV